MKTSTKIMGEMNPCARYDTFKRNYPDFEGDFTDALDLPLANFQDKMWLLKRSFDRHKLATFAAEIIEQPHDELNDYLAEVISLVLAEPTELNRREISKVVTNIVEKVIHLHAHAKNSEKVEPNLYLQAVNEKQQQILEIAKRVSRDE